MPARTPHGRRLDAILADGNWHHLDQVLADVAAAVPPGVAHRHTLAIRARRHPNPALHQSRARNDTITVGARDLARKLIDSRISRGTAQRAGNHIRRT